jgi:ABC-2 type transport system permease protein
MSALSVNPGVASRHAIEDRRPPLSRVTAVELRKMVDTRSGFWVMIGVATITVIAALAAALEHGGRGATYIHVFHIAAQPSAYLLPVLGVLLICGEWTQRTTLTTFTLVPVRRRVIAAKVMAGLLVSTAALIVTLLVSLLFTALFGHASGGAGALPVAVIAQGWLHLGAWMLIGFAFGAAVLVSAPAIVAYLLLPLVCGAIVGSFQSLSGVALWTTDEALDPLTIHALSAVEWAHVGTMLLLWIGVPLLIGVRRIRGGDVN